MHTTATFRGTEIESKAVKIIFLASLVLYVVATLPVTLPLHFILKGLGRQGFLVRKSPWGDEYSWELEAKAFKRAA